MLCRAKVLGSSLPQQTAVQLLGVREGLMLAVGLSLSCWLIDVKGCHHTLGLERCLMKTRDLLSHVQRYTAVVHSAAPSARGTAVLEYMATLKSLVTLLYMLCCVSILSSEERCKCQMRTGAKSYLENSNLQNTSPLHTARVRTSSAHVSPAGWLSSLFISRRKTRKPFEGVTSGLTKPRTAKGTTQRLPSS